MKRTRLEDERPEAGIFVDHASVVHDAGDLTRKSRDMLKRYGLALALASLALFLRGVLPVPEGTAIYQLPIAAVVLSAWYGGRGPGLFASLICATGILYWFVPPVNSFELSPDHALGFSIFIALCLLLSEFSAGRRRAEHALRASEERFRALVQFSFDVYWETDAEHRFTRQEFSERLTDAPAPGAEIGKTRWEIPYVEPDEEAWRKHRATLDAHLPFRDFELARPTADGGKRYVSVSGMPVFDESGASSATAVSAATSPSASAPRRSTARTCGSSSRWTGSTAPCREPSDVEQMLSDVLEAMLDIFACDRAWLIYPCDPDAPSWHAVMERTRPEFPGAVALRPRFAYDAGKRRGGTGGTRVFRRAPARWLPHAPAERRHRGAFRRALGHADGAPSEGRPAIPVRRAPMLARAHVDEGRAAPFRGDRPSAQRRAGPPHRLPRPARQAKRDSRRRSGLRTSAGGSATMPRGHVSLSDEACRIFGVQPLDLPQWHERWLSLIHPEDRENAAAASELALRGGPRYDVEYRVVRPDGAVRVVHSQGDVTRDESGRPVRQFGVMQDITELRQAEEALRESEQRYRTLFEKANDAIFLENDRDDIVDANERACTLLGYSRDELLTMKVPDLQAPEVRGQVGRVIRERIETHGSATFETVDLHRSGRRIPVEVTISEISPSRREPGAFRRARHHRAQAHRSGAAGAAGNARPRAKGGTRGGIRLVHRRARERKPLVAGARGDVWPRAGHLRWNVSRLEEARPSR